MDRRQYLGLVAASTAGLAGCAAPHGDGVPHYRRDRTVAGEHESLSIEASRDRVAVGGSISFEVTNRSESRVALGCHEPWVIERRTETGWAEAVCGCEDAYAMCASFLGAGRTLSKTLTVGNDRVIAEQRVTGGGSAGRERTETVEHGVGPGRHRFFLLGTSPLLAAEFTIEG